jgi:very-short-patch-repair endonuclease
VASLVYECGLCECRNDTLGREAARVIIRKAANDITAISRAWADVAVMLALEGRRPRVDSTPIATQLEQLCLAINRGGLILITEVDPNAPNGGALVHALEWLSHHSQVSIVALFAEQPLRQPPFDRLLYGLRVITGEDIVEPVPIAQRRGHEHPWLAPIRGMPHPLSETEKRLAKHLARDGELGPLFGFNQCVETIRGTRPKVDLLWTVGRLVVELDGYSDHGTRPAFMYDRHRDYELTLSGYTVLRIANEEVVQDIEKAVEKIRDVVHLCRMRQQREN